MAWLRPLLALLTCGGLAFVTALPAAAAPLPASSGLANHLQRRASTRSSTMSVLARDQASGASWSLHPVTRYDSASIVTVTILETVLWQAQRRGCPLTAWVDDQGQGD